MPTKIVVPTLGESVLEATVARWLKHEGDYVSVGEPVVELETEKVNLEVGAEQSGALVRIERQEGEDVQIGDVLGLVDETAEPPAEAPQETEEAPEIPQVAPEEIPESREEIPEAATEAGTPEQAAKKATPVARRLAQEQGVDLAQVPGRGPAGRVTKQDVQYYLEERKPEQEPSPALPATAAYPGPHGGAARPSWLRHAGQGDAPTGAPSRQEKRVRMSRRRRTIARRMVEAQQTAAMLTTFNEIEMSTVMELRRRRKESFRERHGVSLGIVSFFVKASIGALKDFPRLNAEIEGDDILLKRYYDIGVAIGAPEGLVVPVLRDADRMSFAEIEQAIKGFVQKAEDNTLSLEDLRGGTFTITNGGVFGSLLSTPILNPPQVGILGLHKIEERPIVFKGEVVIRPMMYVALSYDHRIVDGREAVQFLVRVKELIEDPETLLLEG
jgi:2-oxoglutarate dehydrogenase E2 component (dihydrolipoamide succinyltransferase)